MIQFIASMLTAWLRRLLGRSEPVSEQPDPPVDTNGGGGPGPRPKG